MTAFTLHQLDGPVNALITGASSGIGLAMTAQLLADDGVADVVAVSRTANASEALQRLRAASPERLQLIDADLTVQADLDRVGQQLRDAARPLHLLVNCAGLLHGDGIRPEKALASLSVEALSKVFALNAFAPILLVRALLPLFKHGQPSVIASLSARVGSIGDNQLGGWYAYRASKAAQNQLFRTLAIELRRSHPNTTCLLLHPGTVDTPLSKPFQHNVPDQKLFTAGRAARQLLDVIAAATPADSGSFKAWDGSTVPW